MRITFICSSLQAGRDGVGDYTRRLAMACNDLGQPSTVIALNDRHLSAPESRVDSGLSTLRLNSHAPLLDRTAAARREVVKSRAEYISFQYVGYGYQEKGIPLGLWRRLRAISGNLPIQVMLHELWSFSEPDTSLHKRLVGYLQRFAAISLLRKVHPAVINTHLPVYRDVLANYGIESDILPLFGNIPFTPVAPSTSLAHWLSINAPTVRLPIGRLLVGGIFGSIHPEWFYESTLALLQQGAEARGEHLVLLAAGRLGERGGAHWEKVAAEQRNRVTCLRVGEQSPRSLSELFQLIDFALASSPWHLLGKSSSAASMLDFGLPLVVSAGPQHGFKPDDVPTKWMKQIHRADHTLPGKMRVGLPRSAMTNSVRQVATLLH